MTKAQKLLLATMLAFIYCGMDKVPHAPLSLLFGFALGAALGLFVGSVLLNNE